MKIIEQLEVDAYRSEMISDLGNLVEKYRKIFDWDIPEVDQKAADKLILEVMREGLDEISAKLAG